MLHRNPYNFLLHPKLSCHHAKRNKNMMSIANNILVEGSFSDGERMKVSHYFPSWWREMASHSPRARWRVKDSPTLSHPLSLIIHRSDMDIRLLLCTHLTDVCPKTPEIATKRPYNWFERAGWELVNTDTGFGSFARRLFVSCRIKPKSCAAVVFAG